MTRSEAWRNYIHSRVARQSQRRGRWMERMGPYWRVEEFRRTMRELSVPVRDHQQHDALEFLQQLIAMKSK